MADIIPLLHELASVRLTQERAERQAQDAARVIRDCDKKLQSLVRQIVALQNEEDAIKEEEAKARA